LKKGLRAYYFAKIWESQNNRLNRLSLRYPSPALNQAASLTINSTASEDQISKHFDSDLPTGDSGSVDNFQFLQVSLYDPCYKVLPSILKKYNVTADWTGYSLWIAVDGREKYIRMSEHPLVIFKALEQKGKKPTLMIRTNLEVLTTLQKMDCRTQDRWNVFLGPNCVESQGYLFFCFVAWNSGSSIDTKA
jgi:Ras association (RalGDS/AF-6) domain